MEVSGFEMSMRMSDCPSFSHHTLLVKSFGYSNGLNSLFLSHA